MTAAVFLGLVVAGLVLSVVGAVVPGLLWLTVIGILLFLGAAAYAALPTGPRASTKRRGNRAA